jgi:single-strand DNA-binding protein
MNRVCLIGNLTRDPELRHTPSGVTVGSLRVAVNEREKDSASGEWRERVNYFDVTVFGRQAENVAQYLSKGRKVGVDGRLRWREWEAQDGTKRQAVEITADRVEFLGSREDGQGRASGDGDDWRQAQPAAASQPSSEPDFVPTGPGVDDDIPF